LIEAESGNHLWADRFDAKLENIFELQDQITRSVVATIEPEIYLSERNKGLTRPPGDLKAWDYLLRAMPHFWRWSDADTLEALRLLGKSIECDRHYALALGVSAYVQWVRGYMGWGEAAELFPSAREAARRAISEDEGEAWGHLALGFIHCVFREHEAALFECQQAIRLNPNYPYAHTAYGFALTCGGKADPALEAVRLARRLNPRDPLIAIPTSVEGMAHMVAGDYELSARLQEQAIQQRPEMVSARRSLISVLGHLGRLEEAKVHLAEVLRHTPSFSLSWVERYHPLVRQEDRGRYIEGLRKAGVPE